MKNYILFSLLFTSLAHATSATPEIPQKVIDQMVRLELKYQNYRFMAKVGCSAEEIPRCGAHTKTDYDEWVNSVNAIYGGAGFCMLKPDEAVNSSGVTDQWKCLNKYQEISEDIWKKKHEEFFQTGNLYPRDFFEIKKKYPKVVGYQGSQFIEDALFIDYKCQKFNFECVMHFNISMQSILETLPNYGCAYAGSPNPANKQRERLQVDQEASEQCLDMAYEIFNKGYKRAIDESIKIDSIPNPAVESWYESWYVKNKGKEDSLKSQFNELKRWPSEFAKDKRFATSPYASIYNRIMEKFSAKIKELDPVYDVSYEKTSVVEPNLATLPIEPVVVPVGEIKNPDAVMGAVRISPTVIDQVFKIKGDYLAPIASYITVKDYNGESVVNVCYHRYKNGEAVKLPYALLESSDSSAPVATSVETTKPKAAEVSPLASNNEANTNKPADTSLNELATLQSKFEIVSDLNCKGDASFKACAYYKTYLTENVPYQLGILCKTDACRENYKVIQQQKKAELMANLYPELDSLVGSGSFVDPFKVSGAYAAAAKEKAAYNNVMKPFLAKVVSVQMLPEVSWKADEKKLVNAVCDQTQQQQTGGDYSACVASASNMARDISTSSASSKGYAGQKIGVKPHFVPVNSLRDDLGGIRAADVVSSPQAKAEAKVDTSVSRTDSAKVDTSVSQKASVGAKKRKVLSREEQYKEAKEAMKVFNP